VLVAGLVAGVLILHPFASSPVAAPVPTPTTTVPAPNTSAASTEPTPDPTPTSPSPTPTQSPATDPAAALAALQELHDGDLPRVPLRGQWVAQIASKRPGTVDRFQRTASGSHRFQAVDILAEHQSLRQRFGSGVVLLLSTDYGHAVRDPQGQVLWVTFYLGQFSSAQDVKSWCPRAFPELSGPTLADTCAARQLRPPS
jgi:hypothetical protein